MPAREHTIDSFLGGDPTFVRALLLVLAVGLTFLVYVPITRNYFTGDDWLTLHGFANGPALPVIVDPSAGHVDIVRRTVFYLCYELFGSEPAGYLWIVLLTHLLNVGLLFALVYRTTGSARLAWFGSVLWGVSPVHEPALGWISCYNFVAAGTLQLVLALDMLGPLDGEAVVPARTVLRWAVLAVLGAMASGIGIAIALVFPLVMLALYRVRRLTPGAWMIALALPPLIVCGYFFAHRPYTARLGGSAHVAAIAASNMIVTWRHILGMLAHLLRAGICTLLLWPTLVPLPPRRFVEGGLVVAYVLGVVRLVRRAPAPSVRVAVMLLLVTVAGYGMIALGRAELLLQREAYGAWTGRYHYPGMAALAAVLCLMASTFSSVVTSRRWGRDAAVVAGTVVVLVLWVRGGWVIDPHDIDRRAATRALDRIHAALAATPLDRPVYIENEPFPQGVLPWAFLGTASVYTIFFPHDDRPVYFVERNPKVLGNVPPGSRLARLITTPDRQR